MVDGDDRTRRPACQIVGDTEDHHRQQYKTEKKPQKSHGSSYDFIPVTATGQRLAIMQPSKGITVSRPDLELVARCRAGDVDAFEALYRQHSPRIYSLACRMTGSPQEGEDLLQEIFLLVHRKLGSYRGESALGTWLYRL